MSLSLLSLFTALSLLPLSSSTVIIGATYSPSATSPPPSSVSSAVASLGLDAVLILNPDAASIHAFLYSNTSLLLTLPNSLVPSVAANRSAASDWISAVVLPFFPRAKIAAVSVGDSSLLDSSSAFVLPAARNLRLALADLGLRGVSVSATFSAASLISSFFPPSAALLRQPAGRNVVVPMLRFLAEANSSFMVSLHPYHLYRAHPEIPIGFALFQDHPFNFRDDLGSGVRYRNLFDVMAGAVASAVAAAGYGGVPLVVAETGWPAGSSDAGEVEANAAYAQLYVRGLVRHLRKGGGGGAAAAYVYELFDEVGSREEWDNRSWGILSRNLSGKYPIDFSAGARVGGFTVRVVVSLFLSAWTREENKMFESALVIFADNTPNRWDHVAAMIPGKSAADVMRQYKDLEEDVAHIEAGAFDDRRRKKGVPWTKEEHRRFLVGLVQYGKGDWRNISRNLVITKNPTQVASHAQKYFLRQSSKDKRSRPSIHDFTTRNLIPTHHYI